MILTLCLNIFPPTAGTRGFSHAHFVIYVDIIIIIIIIIIYIYIYINIYIYVAQFPVFNNIYLYWLSVNQFLSVKFVVSSHQ